MHGIRDCSPLLNGCSIPTQSVRESVAMAKWARDHLAAQEPTAHTEDVAYADDVPEGYDVPDDYERHYCTEDGEEWPCSTVRAQEPTDAQLVDLWWTTCNDEWAVPDDVMVAFGRAVLALSAARRAREETTR